MLDISTLDKIDSKGMYKIYDKWSEFAQEHYKSDLDSIYFAALSGIDPTPINAIDFVKSKLV